MRFRYAIIALALLFSVYMLIHPPEGDESRGFADYKENIKDNINLGLDLKGGIFMQLEVDIVDAVNQFLEEQAGTIKASLENEGFAIATSTANLQKKMVILEGVTSSKHSDIEGEISKYYRGNWSINQKGPNVEMKLKENARLNVENNAVEQTVYKIQSRVDELGVTEPVINRMTGSNRIVVELAGADDVTRVHRIVAEPGKLEWRMNAKNPATRQPISAASTEQQLLAPLGGQVPPGKRIFPYTDERTGAKSFMLLEGVMMTASNVADVYPSTDQQGMPAVGITLDAEGGETFAVQTAQNVNNQLAIVLDGEIISAPSINSRLSNRFIIQGSFTQDEVQDMVVKIKSGSLPAEVRILEERVIGPTLGRDAISSGVKASVFGLLLVVIFILAYYRRAGVYALMALILNLIFILGMLAGIGAVLTLPGIAGFILTIGMAVDANVLVFERIREELRAGTAPKNAVEVGYRTAFVTIMDANITTFLAAFFLLLMGEGPIKGFAIMLMIGIVSSIFTAVFCSHTFFLGYIKRKTTLSKLSIWPVWQGSNS